MIVSALHEAFAQGAPLNTGLILDMIQPPPPLSVTMGERIVALLGEESMRPGGVIPGIA